MFSKIIIKCILNTSNRNILKCTLNFMKHLIFINVFGKYFPIMSNITHNSLSVKERRQGKKKASKPAQTHFN